MPAGSLLSLQGPIPHWSTDAWYLPGNLAAQLHNRHYSMPASFFFKKYLTHRKRCNKTRSVCARMATAALRNLYVASRAQLPTHVLIMTSTCRQFQSVQWLPRRLSIATGLAVPRTPSAR